MITQKSNNRFTLINVVNYCNYQGSEFENEQQMNNQRTTNEQQMNTVKNIRTKEIKNKELKHICESSDSYTYEKPFGRAFVCECMFHPRGVISDKLY